MLASRVLTSRAQRCRSSWRCEWVWGVKWGWVHGRLRGLTWPRAFGRSISFLRRCRFVEVHWHWHGRGSVGLLRSLPRLSWRLRARTQTPSITFRSAHGYSCQQCVSFPRVNVCFSRFAKTSLLPCVAILSPPFFFVCQLVDFCPVSACTIAVTVVAVCSSFPHPPLALLPTQYVWRRAVRPPDSAGCIHGE